jgi:hypothetical protein
LTIVVLPVAPVPSRRNLRGANALSDDRSTWRTPGRYKLVDEKPKTFVLVFGTNDELSQGLKNFASEHKLASASFKAIGALSSVKLGWLNWETKKYEPSVSLESKWNCFL